MTEIELGQIIARRQLLVEGEPGRKIAVLMGAPRRTEETPQGAFECPVQIIGIGDEKILSAFGVDPFQAIRLALQLIGFELYSTLSECSHGRLRWEGSGLDLSFPLSETAPSLEPPSVFGH